MLRATEHELALRVEQESVARVTGTLIERWFQYKGFFFLLAFGWMTQPLKFLFVWSHAATFGAIGCQEELPVISGEMSLQP